MPSEDDLDRVSLPEIYEQDALLTPGQATYLYGPYCDKCWLYHRGDCG